MASPPVQTRLDGFDTSSLSEKDLRILRLYGRLPPSYKATSNPPGNHSRSSSTSSSSSNSPPTSLPNSGSALQTSTTSTSNGENNTAANAATTRFARHLKERKYFDSGDYALSKAGRGNSVDVGLVGSAHPAPGQIPHPSPLSIMQRRRGSSICSGGSGSAILGGLEGGEEGVVGEMPGFGMGGGAGCWGWNGNGGGSNGGRYRRSSLSVAVMGAGGGGGGGFEGGEEGGGSR